MFKWLKSVHSESLKKAQYETEAVFAIKRFTSVDVRELGTNILNEASNVLWTAFMNIPNSTKEDFVWLSFGQFAQYYPFEIGECMRLCGVEYARSARAQLSPTTLEFLQALDDASNVTEDSSDPGGRTKESADIEWEHEEHFDQPAAHAGQNSTTKRVPRDQELSRHDLLNLDEADNAKILYAIKRAGDIDFRDEQGWTLLHWSAWRGAQKTADWLLRSGACVGARSINGMTPLHLVSDSQMTEILLEFGADVAARTLMGSTPLHHAATNAGRDTRVISTLVNSGADIAARCRNGMDLWWMLQLGEFDDPYEGSNYDKCFGYHVSEVSTKSGSTPLLWASMHQSYTSCLKELVDLGASLEDFDEGGNKAVHWAASSMDDQKAISWLFTHGADIDTTNAVGCTPLHLAASRKNTANICRLLDFGAKSMIPDASGWTALHYLVQARDHSEYTKVEDIYSAAKKILDAGGRADFMGLDGESPWSLIEKNPYLRDSKVFWLLNQMRFL